jgi:hypothetical protein
MPRGSAERRAGKTNSVIRPWSRAYIRLERIWIGLPAPAGFDAGLAGSLIRDVSIRVAQ